MYRHHRLLLLDEAIGLSAIKAPAATPVQEHRLKRLTKIANPDTRVTLNCEEG